MLSLYSTLTGKLRLELGILEKTLVMVTWYQGIGYLGHDISTHAISSVKYNNSVEDMICWDQVSRVGDLSHDVSRFLRNNATSGG